MARLKYQFLYSAQPMLTYLEGNFVVGSSGAVGTLKGAGIKAVNRLSTGTYQIVLTQVYPRYLAGQAGFVSPITSLSTATTSGAVQVIANMGTATQAQFQAVGLPSAVTAAVGVTFVPTSSATIGGGAQVGNPSNSGIMTVEVVGDANQTIINPLDPYLVMQCLNSSGAPTDPAAGSVLGFDMFLKNSTAKAGNE